MGGGDAGHGLRHREVPGQRTGEGHRSEVCPAHRPAVRAGDHRCNRNRHRTALRGARHRQEARGEDSRELGETEGHQECDALPAGLWGEYGLCSQDLPPVRQGKHRQGEGESLPAGGRHLGNRFQDSRQHSCEDGLREERPAPL